MKADRGSSFTTPTFDWLHHRSPGIRVCFSLFHVAEEAGLARLLVRRGVRELAAEVLKVRDVG